MPTIPTSVPRQGPRRLRPSRAVVACGLAFASALAAQASSPRFFRAATPTDFLQGEIENLSLDDRGQLTLGPATDLVYEAAAPFLWSVIPGPGGSLFVGTGNEGRVYRVDAAGAGSLVFDATELDAHALATAPDGTLYVGTSPDGRIYRIDQSGAATPFFDPEERYVWALAVDRSGVVYAGTGEAGVVHRISPDGTGTRFYQAGAVHVTALAFDTVGNLLVGTGSPGRVLRVDPSGRAFLLLDSPYREISALRFDAKGQLFVAATNGAGSAPASSIASQESTTTTGQPGAPVAIVTTEVTSMAVADAPADTPAPAATTGDSRLPRGAVYRIAPDGLWDKLWEPRDDVPYDLAFDENGRLIVATGNQGKIFRLDGEPPQPTLVARAAAQQVTALHRDAAGRLYLATSNPGKLLRLSAGRAAQGAYESAVQDAGTVATWGRIAWRASTPAGSRVEVFTRSGNTEAQDDTWSPWSPAYAEADGSPITSPKARYLQWRVVLAGKGESPVVTSVTAAYLQRNLRPEVQAITVHPPGIVFQRPFTSGEPELAGFEDQTTLERRLSVAAAQQGGSAPALGRRAYAKGLQTLVWRAADENEDDLTFSVQYRREGEAAWRTLRTDLTVPLLVWDTTTVPNGTYFVRIVASDAPGNDPALALTGELVSQAFEVDNTPPRVSAPVVKADARGSIVTFEVADEHSPIRVVEYSIDGVRWRSVFPVDGLADSRVERYEIRVEEGIGAQGLSIRASDAMNNGAAAQVEPAAANQAR